MQRSYAFQQHFFTYIKYEFYNGVEAYL